MSNLSKSTKEAILEKTGGKCFYCGIELRGWYDDDYTKGCFSIDHFVPKSKGGTDEIDNLFPCCYSCNCTRRNKDIEEFRVHQAFKYFGIPKFSKEQIDYLYSMGFRFPDEFYNYKFWFETNTSFRVRRKGE